MASLWQTLLHPDLDDNPDKSLIAEAANILEIGEFQLIQLAYNEWYGRDMAEREQDRIFDSYMLAGQVAPWMRDFARKIVEKFEQGDIDINDPAYHRFDVCRDRSRRRLWRRFAAAALILAGVMILLILLADRATDNRGSVFPPYFENDTNTVFPPR